MWWKDGDSEHVTPYKAKTKALELCTLCGQAFEVHGKVGATLVHPGDTIVSKDGGDIEVVRPDPFAQS
jgi:hypothetical protein